MGRQSYDKHRAALILAEAAFDEDKNVAKKFKCHARTIAAYRAKLKTDPELETEYRLALFNKTTAWCKDIPDVLGDALRFIKTSMWKLDGGDPESVKAVISAVEKLYEIYQVNELIKNKIK